ncbi:SEC-C motif-containing protein / OTU-like cysteine protease family protein isoform X3 [Tasmannia lanceolata]|uniref:SEC-C motif-containing protein / OTU-like cysteine protease family protein isoform X3 n=1 Tax=Tasmannia lanceolata TaxID=3420 RepID=UPI0040644A03
MVQAKHKKSKPKKLTTVKKHGKQGDIAQFRSQLDALGLKVIQVTADGNCFFRALADQLEGNEEEHGKYRRMVVEYIMKNQAEFEPFIEDDVPFDEYCKSMEKDGSWAGHMELQAACLVTRSNTCIHRGSWGMLTIFLMQTMSPRWYIRNFVNQGARMIHLSYHDGEHYNSVRIKEDICSGPARPIVIKADADLATSSHQAKAQTTKSKGISSKNVVDTQSVKIVMSGTGCENAEKVKQVLLDVDGDIDAAIEFLTAAQETDVKLVEHDELPYRKGDDENGNCEQPKEAPPQSKTCEHNKASTDIPIRDKIPRNKVCPCGSKKKYKACCGSGRGELSQDFYPRSWC